MDFTKLFSDSSPAVVGFINKLSVGVPRPHFRPGEHLNIPLADEVFRESLGWVAK